MTPRHNWTVDDVISRLSRPSIAELPGPAYVRTVQSNAPGVTKVALAVASMKDHMTDEGWQIMQGLQEAGYLLAGHGLPYPITDVRHILGELRPSVMFVQDKREWAVQPGNFRDPLACFINVGLLRDRQDIFKLTIIKDAQQNPTWHRESADEIGCHAWVTYYHPHIVHHLAPYVRPKHLIRTWHTIDAAVVPDFSSERPNGALLSGALSSAYQLRMRVAAVAGQLPSVTHLRHPGYHRRGCATPGFLRTLSSFKVALCTASRFGYALRKIVEATACGCLVITDLPADDVLPFIDENLIRVHPDVTVSALDGLLRSCYASYDPDRQRQFAERAKILYDYRAMGRLLNQQIDMLRWSYEP
jgi:hypothetical protein